MSKGSYALWWINAKQAQQKGKQGKPKGKGSKGKGKQ